VTLSARDERDELMAVWFTHAFHPVCLGATTEISAEWPGIARKAASEILGCPCQFAQGCSGDVDPKRSPAGDCYISPEEAGLSIAEGVEAGFRNSRPLEGGTVAATLEHVTLPTIDEPGGDFELEVQAVRIHDLAIVGLSAEPFVRIGEAIRAVS